MNCYKLFAAAALVMSANAAMAADWMAEVEGSAYVNQLSIPGTHDCGTGNGFSGLGALVGSSMGLTQDLNLSAQWDCGVRAFDLRPAVKSGSLEIYHGILQTKLSLSAALSTLCQKLDAHPTEFAMVFLRHETDGDNGDSSWAGKMAEQFGSVADHMVAWSPELTVAEARGKIVAFTRDAFSSASVATISGWSHSSDFASQQGASATCGGSYGRMFVQDFYDCTGSGAADTKAAAVKRMYEFSSTLAAPSADLIQVVNHTSGYTTSASTSGNRDLAAKANAALLEVLADESVAPGPTGVVFMDFAGVDSSSKIAVRGKELVDAIIANNSRYEMRTSDSAPDETVYEPTVSTETEVYWHSITATRRGGKVASVDTASSTLVGITADVANPPLEAQWKIDKRNNGTFNIVNRATGEYMAPDAAVFNQAVPVSATEPRGGWRISEVSDAPGFYVIYCGSTVQLNQTTSVYDFSIFNWYGTSCPNLTDEGCLFRFRVVDTEQIETPEPEPEPEPEPDPNVGINEVASDEVQADAPLYDLSGRRVVNPTRQGLYISRGRKVVKL